MNPLKKIQYSLRFRDLHFSLNWFLVGFINFCIAAWFFNSVKPEGEWVIGTGIIVLSFTIFSFINSFLNNVRRTGIVMSGVVGFLLLRALKLHDLLYYLILLAFVISLEFATKKK